MSERKELHHSGLSGDACPACKEMDRLGQELIEAVNRAGANGLYSGDRIRAVTRLLATGVVVSAKPGMQALAGATAAVIQDLMDSIHQFGQALQGQPDAASDGPSDDDPMLEDPQDSPLEDYNMLRDVLNGKREGLSLSPMPVDKRTGKPILN